MIATTAPAAAGSCLRPADREPAGAVGFRGHVGPAQRGGFAAAQSGLAHDADQCEIAGGPGAGAAGIAERAADRGNGFGGEAARLAGDCAGTGGLPAEAPHRGAHDPVLARRSEAGELVCGRDRGAGHAQGRHARGVPGAVCQVRRDGLGSGRDRWGAVSERPGPSRRPRRCGRRGGWLATSRRRVRPPGGRGWRRRAWPEDLAARCWREAWSWVAPSGRAVSDNR